MDLPDILKILIFEDFLKIAKKGPPQGPYWSPFSNSLFGATLPGSFPVTLPLSFAIVSYNKYFILS